MSRGMLGRILCALAVWGLAGSAAAQSSEAAAPALALLELRFTPVERAQLAIWLEHADGTFASTVRLTEAVALRGIGNRPGAAQMNSGFRWPYGRREGVLPVWARRRSEAPGARQWKRVIFQDRLSEGLASRTTEDSSRDDYYCLSFDQGRSSKDALDAVSCATPFSSDKGRFITRGDVAARYAEPYETSPGVAAMRALSLHSLYPPRRDVERCPGECFDHADVALFADHAREVMPDIDAVTMATPLGGAPQHILYPVPAHFPPGDYRACIEVNVEGDYNETFNPDAYPTPGSLDNPDCLGRDGWDYWALCWGYPYRGQPSVVYCADVTLGGSDTLRVTVDDPMGGAGGWEIDSPDYGAMQSMDGMTDDPVSAPGSGADRLQLQGEGNRLEVLVRPSDSCAGDMPPGAVTGLRAEHYGEEVHAHEWATLRFDAAGDDHGIFRYEVRTSTSPITDDASFMGATPAKQASIEAEELRVPTDAPAGAEVAVELGGLIEQTHYFIGVRAMDACGGTGPVAVAELTTPRRVFATVSPCFVATAAYGTPLADEIRVLRAVRDRYLASHALGRLFVDAYYAVGPTLAGVIAEHEGLRSAARAVLRPVVALSRALLGAEPD